MPCCITMGHYLGLSLGECIGEWDRTSEVTMDRGSAILDNHTTNGNNKYHSKMPTTRALLRLERTTNLLCH